MPLFILQPAPAIISNEAVAFSGASSTAATATNVYLYAFELAVPVTITAARWRNGTVIPGHTSMAIYDANGNIIPGSDTGAQADTANTETTFTYATPFVIGPGLYYMALACDAADNFLCVAMPAANEPITRARRATNSLALGAMPLTTGALTTASFQPVMAFLRSGGLA